MEFRFRCSVPVFVFQFGMFRVGRFNAWAQFRDEGVGDMNLYATLGSSIGTNEALSLSARLSAWHDDMVAHERRIGLGRSADVCHDECPHAEATALWSEVVALFGARADELVFLRSRGSDTRLRAAGRHPQGSDTSPLARRRVRTSTLSSAS